MAKTKEKVTLSLDARTVAWVDEQVSQGVYESRSSALEKALMALYAKREEEQYEEALALLDPDEERALAEEGMAEYSRLVLGSTEWEGVRDRAAV